MFKRSQLFFGALMISALSVFASAARAWDHPGHMLTAAIAFSEIERSRPDLIEKLGLLFLKHPDPAPFWVAAGEAKGKERVRRMFIRMLPLGGRQQIYAKGHADLALGTLGHRCERRPATSKSSRRGSPWQARRPGS